jgi:hypothetical protein
VTVSTLTRYTSVFVSETAGVTRRTNSRDFGFPLRSKR